MTVFIKLTDYGKQPVWVNTAQIQTIEPNPGLGHYPDGSIIRMEVNSRFNVMELPEQILDKIATAVASPGYLGR